MAECSKGHRLFYLQYVVDDEVKLPFTRITKTTPNVAAVWDG